MENMDMLFNSETRFELEHVYSWNNFTEVVVNALTKKSDNFASLVKSRTTAVNRSIAKTMDYLAKGSN
jgi:hypothetical protein